MSSAAQAALPSLRKGARSGPVCENGRGWTAREIVYPARLCSAEPAKTSELVEQCFVFTRTVCEALSIPRRMLSENRIGRLTTSGRRSPEAKGRRIAFNAR